MNTMFALVDANNMYVSCERVFQPRLHNRPVVVLSSNDGVCIARSNEAKALGVHMAQPWFQVRHLVKSAGLIAISANFELYNDLSQRMMAIAARYAPDLQVYSIDECFLSFAGIRDDLADTARNLRAAVLRETGLPTSIGIAPTMTLAKLANHVAKTAERKPGLYPQALAQVCDLGAMDALQREPLFAATETEEVWGIGRKTSEQLQQMGIRTVFDLVRTEPRSLGQRFSVAVEKVVRELRGQACRSLDDAPEDRQQILVSRSFAGSVTDMGAIIAAVSEFVSRAAERLRLQGSVAGSLTVFFATSPYRRQAQHQVNVTLPLGQPTGDTALLVGAAVKTVRKHFRDGFGYARAGVILTNLSPQSAQQVQLDLGVGRSERPELMRTIDDLNRRFGRNAVQIGSTSLARSHGTREQWESRQALRSPRFTTRWQEMPVVRTSVQDA